LAALFHLESNHISTWLTLHALEAVDRCIAAVYRRRRGRVDIAASFSGALGRKRMGAGLGGQRRDTFAIGVNELCCRLRLSAHSTTSDATSNRNCVTGPHPDSDSPAGQFSVFSFQF
jgi:hypothetical protein